MHQKPCMGFGRYHSTINNLHYADDTILLAVNMRDLQELLNKVVTSSRHFGLTQKRLNT